MRRFSILAVVLVVVGAIFTGVVFPVVAHSSKNSRKRPLISRSRGMKCSKRSFTLASRTFAAAQTAKQQCINTCRARHRSCLSAKQILSIECRGIYQDCTRYTCNAGPAGRPTGLIPE